MVFSFNLAVVSALRCPPQNVIRYVVASRMNVFERIGIFGLRLLATGMLLIAIMGLVGYVGHEASGTGGPDVSARGYATAEWLVAGLVLAFSAKWLGTWLGRGLG